MATPRKPGAKKGRPTKYKPEFCQRLIEFMKKGYSFEAFPADIGVHADTLYHWVNTIPEFSEAKKDAEVASRKFWETVGIRMAVEGKGNVTAWIFMMKNRYGWRDKQDIEISGKDGKPLEVQTTVEERTRRIDETRQEIDRLKRLVEARQRVRPARKGN